MKKELSASRASRNTKERVEQLKQQKRDRNLVEKDVKNQIEEIQSMMRLMFMDTYSMTSIRW